MHDVVANDENEVAEEIWVKSLAPGGRLLRTFHERRDKFHAKIISEVGLFNLKLGLVGRATALKHAWMTKSGGSQLSSSDPREWGLHGRRPGIHDDVPWLPTPPCSLLSTGLVHGGRSE